MRVVVVTPPAPVVTLAQAKAHLRVDDGDSDALITGMIAAATRGLDGPDGWLGRALGSQTLTAFPDPADFPLWSGGKAAFDLPYPPTRSQDAMAVTGVTHLVSVASTAIDPSTYSMAPGARRLRFNYGSIAWGDDVAITYQTGTPLPTGDGAVAPIADEVRCAILLIVGSLWSNREADVIDARAVVAENPAVDRLLTPYRVWRV